MVNIYRNYLKREFGTEIRQIEELKQEVADFTEEFGPESLATLGKVDDLNEKLSELGEKICKAVQKDK